MLQVFGVYSRSDARGKGKTPYLQYALLRSWQDGSRHSHRARTPTCVAIQGTHKSWSINKYKRYIHAYTYTHVYIRTYICTYLPTCLPTYIHTYIHTCVHIYATPPCAYVFLSLQEDTYKKQTFLGRRPTFQFSNFSGPNLPFFQLSNFLGLTFHFSNFLVLTFHFSNFPIFQFFWA